ncbi:MAG: ABC transporter ATP-binding protein [Stomatobaculum sp.]|nr:ABC transporter ATP-binding protein [Stomatobaculum sp.]
MAYVVRAEKVSIRYMTGDFKDIGLKEYFMRRLTNNYKVREFWADRDVSFRLDSGDMLGIIGSNGAGKSTLLKAVSGIMVPTEGWVDVRGKIAALLELASGFDGDLTVRENAYLRGALLGYTREFMDRKYDDIIAFAELQDFQERRFKQLSSGMKSRLAFSIACLVEPDILILDEVLSVGDGAFRKKSETKMKEILKSGVTGILVSHSIGQVRSMSNKVLWLNKGKQICFSDEVEKVCDAYEEFLITKNAPESPEGIERMAAEFRERKAREKAEREKTEQERLLELLQTADRNAAERAAREFLGGSV